MKRPIVSDANLQRYLRGARTGNSHAILWAIVGLDERDRTDEAINLAKELMATGFGEAAGALADMVFDEGGTRPDEQEMDAAKGYPWCQRETRGCGGIARSGGLALTAACGRSAHRSGVR
jgi:hypothetical protein